MTTPKDPAGKAADGVQEPASRSTTSVTHAAGVPEYLSGEWWQLDPDDWRRQASIVIAANRWATIAESAYGWSLLDEATDWGRRRTFSEWSSAVSEMVHGRTLGPSYVELERRRAVVGPRAAEFAQRHGHPYRGGAVDWDTGRPKKTSSDVISRGAA